MIKREVTVTFPDLPGVRATGKTIGDAFLEAVDVLDRSGADLAARARSSRAHDPEDFDVPAGNVGRGHPDASSLTESPFKW